MRKLLRRIWNFVFEWKWKLALTIVILIVSAVACIFLCDMSVEKVAEGRHYDDVNKIPHRNVGLLLGTSKFTIFGRNNEYYQRRIEAAYELYSKGKIDTILISGDNSKKDYNEPETMMADLVALGIPKDRFVLDYAGFRTLDSVVRAKNVFGRDSVTIISQEFHNVRALYLAENFGVNAIAYNALYPIYRKSFRIILREKLARVKVVSDVLFGVKPKFEI